MRIITQFMGFIIFTASIFILTLVPGGLWTILLSANLKTGIEIPWSVPASLLFLWIAWRYAGGSWPWRKSDERRSQRRANKVSLAAAVWALIANACALVALAGLWIILKELIRQPGNHLPDFSNYPRQVVILVLSCAAIVGAVSEEVGFRGYLQGRLEKFLPGPVAVLMMALIAAPGHALTQGFVWPTILFYLLADLTYGVTAYLTNSVVPGILAHATGLFVFFAVIWPNDPSRPMVQLGSADPRFWLLVALVLVFGVLTVLAFARLAQSTAATRTSILLNAEPGQSPLH